MDLKFHAVRAMLQRGNPALPPRTRCGPGKAQRRLDAAFEIAQSVAALCGDNLESWADWGARFELDAATSGDPLYRDLAGRLAGVVFPRHDAGWINDRMTAAWMRLYTRPDSSQVCGYAPRDWAVVYPDGAIVGGVVYADASSAADRLLAAAAAVDGSFTYEPETIGVSRIIPAPGQCLTAAAVRLINKLSSRACWHDRGDGSPHLPSPLPIPTWYPPGWGRAGEAYRDYDLARLAAVRMHTDSGNLDAAQRVAHALGLMASRSWWSGHIDGSGFTGASRRCETRAHEVQITLGPWADHLDQVSRWKITSAIIAGVQGRGLPQQACRDALLPLVVR